MASSRVWTSSWRIIGQAPRLGSIPAPSLASRRISPEYRRLPSTSVHLRWFASDTNSYKKPSSSSSSDSSSSSSKSDSSESSNPFEDDWEDNKNFNINTFADLPHRLFGVNQHMIINNELKEVLRLMLRQFNAPIVYCFAYGSGVFSQSSSGRTITDAEFRAVHPKPPEALMKAQKGTPKMIDFIFGVTHTQHWHSINMRQHRDHYSSLAALGSGAVTRVQERWGAGLYFHPYITVNGMLIKYGVTSIDNLVRDLSTWENLYLAGRLQKPVKILRDHARVRLANQHNLIAAIRTALLLLPDSFTEQELYSTIAGISYLGDPRMSLPAENPTKISNIVQNNAIHFRRLYAPLLKTLPNVAFTDGCPLDDDAWVMDPDANNKLVQDMDPVKRGNMVRRLPSAFRSRLYFQYQKKFKMPKDEFTAMLEESSDEGSKGVKRRQGGGFERRIAQDDKDDLKKILRQVIRNTVNWPSTTQSLKGPLTAGWSRTWRYLMEKVAKWREGKTKMQEAKKASKEKEKEKEKDRSKDEDKE